jgi:hypothetical protein
VDVDWSALGAMLQGLTSLVVAAAAWLGLRTWKEQLTSTRRQAIAEEALTLTFRVGDAFAHLRSPIAFHYELNKVERGPDESEEAYQARRTYAVLEVRIAEYGDLFAKLQTVRYQVLTVLGEEPKAAIDNVLKALTELRTQAANAALFRKQVDDFGRRLSSKHYSTVQVAQDAVQSRLEAAEKWVWGWGSEDPVGDQIKGYVTAVADALKDDVSLVTTKKKKR